MIDVYKFVVLRKFDSGIAFIDCHCDEERGQLSINWKYMGTSNKTRYRPVQIMRRNVHNVRCTAFHPTFPNHPHSSTPSPRPK